MLKIYIAGLLASAILSLPSYATKIYEKFPEKIQANEKYVFYSHGFIVEGENPRPVSPRWGIYEFPKIKAALANEAYNLIAYHRPSKTQPNEFAKKLGADVNHLIKHGVRPENITLVGFSRGGEITVLTSNYLKLSKVNIALLGTCSNFIKDKANYKVVGNVYSIYETSDGNRSCQFLIDQSEMVDSLEEISISTGEEHGAFYRPMPQWIEPLKAWLKR